MLTHVSLSTCLLTDEEKTLGRVRDVLLEFLQPHEHIPTYILVTSMQYYKKLYDTDMERRGIHVSRRASTFTATVAACTYYAFKYHAQPRTPQEVCALFHITRPLFSKGCHHCAEIACLPLLNDTDEKLYLRFANQLRIPYSSIRYGWDSLYMPIRPYTNQYKPAAIAGGLICAVLEIVQLDTQCKHLHKLSIRDVCATVGVCVSIIRSVKDTILQQEYHRERPHDETKPANDGFDELFQQFFGDV